MSAARLAGAITAAILGLLLVWLAIASIGQEDLVKPTVGVRLSETEASPQSSVQDILAARTRLMDDRHETGEQAFPPLSRGDHQLTMSPGVLESTDLVRDWQTNRAGADILRTREDVVGTSSVPYVNADLLQQPGGRAWRRVHNDQVRYGGGWLIFGVAFALAVFLFVRGRIKIAEGWSGRTVERFSAIERANHWMTASAFIVMGLTGLIIIYGKPLLLPLVGEAALGEIAWWSVWLHMASAVPFTLGIILMAWLWLRQNLPTWLDWEWLKRGGGFLGDDGNNPPARRFNAGQKVVFWGVVLSGLALLATGIVLMFPFYWFDYDGMQAAQTIHAVIALAMVGLILGHIYIGTIGMEGAFDAMWSGDVDRNWAKEHHSIWYREITEHGGKQ